MYLNPTRARLKYGGVLLALFAAVVLGFVLPSLARAAWPGENGKIAFKSGQDEIWTVNPDGTSLTQLTFNSVPATCRSDGAEEPVWSPDGSKIVYTSSKSSTRKSGSWTPTAPTRPN